MAQLRTESSSHLLSALNEDANGWIRRHKGSTVAGKDVDLRTPFFEDLDRPALKELASSDVADVYVGSGLQNYEVFELEQLPKAGSASIILPWVQRRADVEAYWDDPPLHFPFSEMETAFSRVRSLLPENSLKPTSLETAVLKLPSNTLLGLPLLTSGRDNAGPYLERASQLLIEPSLWEETGSNASLYPFVLGVRTVADEIGQPSKQRVVWMSDHAETIIGQTILSPWLDVAKTIPEFSAFLGPEGVNDAVTALLDNKRYIAHVSIDYSGYDKSLNRYLLNLAWDCVQSWFIETAYPAIELERMASLHAGLLVPGSIYTNRDGSMPSGLTWTNALDSIINLAIGFYSARNLGYVEPSMLVMGDDALRSFEHEVSTVDIAQVEAKVGVTMNASKSYLFPDACIYLQHLHERGFRESGRCVGVKSYSRTLYSLANLERLRSGWSGYMYSVRAIMQLEGMRYSPGFNTLVARYYDEDRVFNTEKLTTGQVVRLAGGAREIASILGIESFQGQFRDPSSLSSFRVSNELHRLVSKD